AAARRFQRYQRRRSLCLVAATSSIGRGEGRRLVARGRERERERQREKREKAEGRREKEGIKF
ncbi:hypothetical protein ACOSB0_00060, partial [Candidatus Phytoplasma citri]